MSKYGVFLVILAPHRMKSKHLLRESYILYSQRIRMTSKKMSSNISDNFSENQVTETQKSERNVVESLKFGIFLFSTILN